MLINFQKLAENQNYRTYNFYIFQIMVNFKICELQVTIVSLDLNHQPHTVASSAMGFKAGWVKPMKPIRYLSLPSHGAGGLVSQCGSIIRSP